MKQKKQDSKSLLKEKNDAKFQKNLKKSKKVIIILAIIMLIFILLFFYSDKNTTDNSSDERDVDNSDDLTLSSIEELKKEGFSDDIIQNVNYSFIERKEELTSYDKIEEDLNNSKITQEKAIELILIAGYYKKELPSKYYSEYTTISSSQIQAAKWWLSQNLDKLDTETKEKLEPFYFPAHNLNSHFNKNDVELKEIVDFLTIIPDVNAVTTKSSLTAYVGTSPKAKIYYTNSEQTRAQWVKDAVELSWVKHKGLLGKEPANYVEINFVHGVDWDGQAWPTYGGNQMFCQIEVRDNMSKDLTQAAIAHELFHCFQFAIGMKYEKEENKWLMEATATWSQNYVYPKTNTEHEYLSGFFYYLPKNLIYWGGKGNVREYNSYMFILYLNQKLNSDSIVKNIMYRSIEVGATKAVEELEGFDSLFTDFALWNYDEYELIFYKDYPQYLPDYTIDEFPTNPYGLARTSLRFKNPETKTLNINLNKGGIKFNTNLFYPQVNKITFKLNKGDEKHSTIAVIKLKDGTRYVEDWTYIEERTFCKSIVFEDAEAVTLIYSNSDLHNNYNTKYTVETEKDCYADSYGSMTVTWDDKKTQVTTGIDKSAKSTEINKGTFTQKDVLRYDGEGDYEVLRQSVSYTAQKGTLITGDGTCGWDHDNTMTERSGSYFTNFEGSGSEPTKIRVDLDDDDKKTNQYYFDAEPNVPNYNWISSVTTIDTLWVPCDSSVPPTLNFQVISTKSKAITLPSNSFDFTNNPKNTHISGVKIYDGNGYDATLTYDYTLKD